MSEDKNSPDLLKSMPMNPTDAEQARKIYQSIIDSNKASSVLDEQEKKKMAEWEAVCKSQSRTVEPLKAMLDADMNPKVLNGLWGCNQLFLKELSGFENAAQELDRQGRTQLHQSLQAWKHDTEATNLMIQYVLHNRQPAQTAAAATPAPMPAAVPPAAGSDKQALLGLWDITLADGRRVELALDDGNFSYVLAGGNYAYWGAWSLATNSGSFPWIVLTRKGGYPVRYYGPLGASDPFIYPATETWGITAAQLDTVYFGSIAMVRRKGVPLPAVTARISDVQVQFQLADVRDQSNASLWVGQRNAIASVQDAMWGYINSGAGRPR